MELDGSAMSIAMRLFLENCRAASRLEIDQTL